MSAAKMKELTRAYGFDEVAIVPGDVTINPDQANTQFSLDGQSFDIPVLASAMDAIVSPEFAGHMEKAGGLAVMNLEGVQTRYEDPTEPLSRVVAAPGKEATQV
ncbi:MAG: IMP dehydrogenase, partial [Dehalococcoidia bacterium]|nr:IMP dehydrogenase [Dehalococcoidia bacterium]